MILCPNRPPESERVCSGICMIIFGHLSNRDSLSDLVVTMEAHAGKLYHLGIGKSVTRSNLSKTNEQRNYRIFVSIR